MTLPLATHAERRIIPTGERALSSVVLSPVRQAGYWRVKIAWPNHTPRYFGKFNSQAEAEKWIEEHRWLIEQRQERMPTIPTPQTTVERSFALASGFEHALTSRVRP
jgi:hypothetical protein